MELRRGHRAAGDGRPLSRIIWLTALLCFPAMLMGGAAPATVPNLTVIQSPTLIVDPTRDPNDGAQAILTLRNATPATVKLELTTGDLIDKATEQPLNVGVTLTPLAGAHGTAPFAQASAAPMEVIRVRAAVSQVLEVGEWDADLLNDGAKIGTLKVIRPAQPFALTLDVPQPDHPVLTVTRGGRGVVGFKNDDSVAHTIAWGLRVQGKKLSAGSGRPAGGKCPASAVITVPAYGSARAFFDPPADWFCFFCSGLVKNETASGELSTRLLSRGCASGVCAGSPDAPSRTFKVTVELASFSPGWVDFLGYLAAFIFLYAGGFLSLWTNVWLPNYRRRQEAADQLDAVEPEIASLSMTLASRLRVLAAQEQHSLKAQVGQLKAWRWAAQDVLANLQVSIARLQRRVGILQQLGVQRAQFEPLRTNDSPPSLVETIDNCFEATVELLDSLETNDADLQSAQANLDDIKERIARLREKNPDFEKRLSARAGNLAQDLGAGGALRKSDYCESIKDKLPGLFNDLARVAGNEAGRPAPWESTPGEYARWDMVFTKLELVRKYVTWCDAGQRTGAAAVGEELAALLLIFSLEGLDRARRFIREMHQGIFAQDIAGEIRAERVKIRKDRYEVRQFAPTQFYLEFDEEAFNSAAAKEEWTCVWDFDHKSNPGMERNMQEYGWRVFHYFPGSRRYKVQAKLTPREDGTAEQTTGDLTPIKRDIFVAEPRQPIRRRSKRGDLLMLFIALLPPLAGLLAGAKDEFMKLSLVPAVGAIVALGFFSDQVKNVLISPKK